MSDAEDALDGDHDLPQSRQVNPQLGADKIPTWRRPFHIKFDQVTLTGGSSKTKTVVNTMTFKMPDGAQEKFTHVNTKTDWFRNSLTQDRGRFRYITAFQSIRELLQGDEPEEAADAAGADVDDAPDPMDALSDVEVDQQIANPQPKRRRRSVTQKTEVAVVRMTRLPPCDDEYDANDLVDVKCLRKGGRGGASPIHISVSNLTWLLTCVQSELVHLSVCEEQPELDLDAESSAAADYTIQWDFQQSHFRATVRTGDHAGKERTLHPDHIGGYRLARAKEHACDQSLGRRDAAKIFLASWCKAVIANDDASFEANWSDSGGGDTPAGSSTCAATDSPGDSFASSQVQQSGSSDAPAVAGPHHELTQSEGPAVTTSHGSHNQSPSSPHPSTSAVADSQCSSQAVGA